ncbi:bifunctional [glutamate--ammonia ligase]-adenylyl-L-tyrosine phosphorylase/[glutamate--ammonia-ligase] adenylyltransferase [Sphingomonas sp.]|uniref:bifunctional [glutamate--ammonia ligase]-adenylyl-L-tyrosine phosphorylase/[glutamate--ammonia-ligase] adenylyltransferase n=1 Tax=Sphingomonas sp. TaxID=28214 RepID=UPI000DB51120|nr:bifunctional [glutamate--ammonia ligase]-adenylyl-L-tyrosine phosphorylase/[glutamate--ammonia-ligase] adenylyltransferase [Sphingomonas sp.]PZU11807.1 MAG: bifunctional [glutamate--ammonia ligase]-adenylyl-L-tyrosine phosphorylase/[glutamate--ammonia-ligase] adenylyltransferase [Sphingomonas sp.]
MTRPDLDEAIGKAERHAPFLRRLIARRGDVVDRLAAEGLGETLAFAQAEADAEKDDALALRRQRQAVALAVALADLGGAPLETVTRALSDFADHALDRAIRAAIRERGGGGNADGFVALALGKQGSRELNYSSDIDPILLFDPRTLWCRPREEPGEAAQRIARRIVELLQQQTIEGYVLRVDLRLRPAAEATSLAVSIDLAIAHYESSALPWERAAFIRARAAAGDIAMGAAMLDHLRPFVWRRGLDFGAIGELRDLSRRIRDHHGRIRAPAPGYDVKRGRGGIREIEFFAQIHQLIHGGREPSLRAPATLDALAALSAAGRIDPAEAGRLSDTYRLLRTIEHRLQMVEDRQTHRLPEDPAALDDVARLAGLDGGAALIALLAPATEAVGRLYDALEADGAAPLPGIPSDLAKLLADHGFPDPAQAAARIDAWRSGQTRTTRSAAAREALEKVLPTLIAALAEAADPQAALLRFDDLVGRLPSALNLFRLLEARPSLLGLLVRVLALAPALAADLARRASLIDGLIDASALAAQPAAPALAAMLRRGEAGEDYQGLLDRVRADVGERRFALGVQAVAAAADPLAVGAGYGRVAEAALDVLATATIAEFEKAHGRIVGGELVILALGRFGGGTLTHASDLDLVYLFTGDFMAESDGARPLGATHYFNRLASRVSAAMSVPTPSGPLYEIDTRLRPSGTQGLLAVSLDSFERYQAESAWTWEHMALERARPVFGSQSARAALAGIIDRALRRPRDAALLAVDVAKMRADMAVHKPAAGPFDVKLIGGGLIDAEFAVHLLQLRERIGITPDLAVAAVDLEAAGLLAPGFADALALLTRMLIVLRLVAPGGAEPPEPSRALLAEACAHANWDDLLLAYDAARALIGGEWRRVAGIGRGVDP